MRPKDKRSDYIIPKGRDVPSHKVYSGSKGHYDDEETERLCYSLFVIWMLEPSTACTPLHVPCIWPH